MSKVSPDAEERSADAAAHVGARALAPEKQRGTIADFPLAPGFQRALFDQDRPLRVVPRGGQEGRGQASSVRRDCRAPDRVSTLSDDADLEEGIGR
jgi:hypothetical protein